MPADGAGVRNVVIMGADKWEQVNDVRYYAHTAARDDALRRRVETQLDAAVVAHRGRGCSGPGGQQQRGGQRGHERRRRRPHAAERAGLVLDERLTIACGSGAVRLLDVQRQGFTAPQREQLGNRWPAAIAAPCCSCSWCSASSSRRSPHCSPLSAAC